MNSRQQLNIFSFLTRIGSEDDMELKIESIIEGCNDVAVSTRESTGQHREDVYSTPCSKRKRLSEAVLVMQNPCQARCALLAFAFQFS